MESIKLYRREIRPMLHELGTQGFSPRDIPLIGEDSWYPEDVEEEIRKIFEPAIESKHHGWVKLFFEERYVYYGDNYLLCKADEFPVEKRGKN